MTDSIIIIIVAILLLVLAFKKNSKTKVDKKGSQGPTSKTYNFYKSHTNNSNKIKTSKVEIGEELNIYADENNNVIKAYKKKTYGGEGFVGLLDNNRQFKKIKQDTKQYKYKATVKSMNKDYTSITIKFF